MKHWKTSLFTLTAMTVPRGAWEISSPSQNFQPPLPLPHQLGWSELTNICPAYSYVGSKNSMTLYLSPRELLKPRGSGRAPWIPNRICLWTLQEVVRFHIWSTLYHETYFFHPEMCWNPGTLPPGKKTSPWTLTGALANFLILST